MANICVNEEQWNAVPMDERELIITGLRATGALRSDDQIVGDPSVERFTSEPELEPMWNPLRGIQKVIDKGKDFIREAERAGCKLACDATAAAACAWCTANTVGAGLVVCIGVAETARSKCRKGC